MKKNIFIFLLALSICFVTSCGNVQNNKKISLPAQLKVVHKKNYKKIIKKLKSKGFPHDLIEYIINDKFIIPFLKDGVVTLKEVHKGYYEYNKCIKEKGFLENISSSLIGHSDFFIKPAKNQLNKKDMEKELENNVYCETHFYFPYLVETNEEQVIGDIHKEEKTEDAYFSKWSCMRRHKLLPKTYSLKDFKRDYSDKDLDTPNPNNLLTYFATNSHKIPRINKNQYDMCARNIFDLPSYTDEYDWAK